MVLATRNAPTAVIARVPVNELWTAKRVLDAGAQGVIFPFSSTPELARQAVDACRYPPLGRRGSGPGLAEFSWPESPYHDSADANVFVIAIVEEARAIEKIDEIAATPGLDALFVGTTDLRFHLDYAAIRIIRCNRKRSAKSSLPRNATMFLQVDRPDRGTDRRMAHARLLDFSIDDRARVSESRGA